MLVTILHQGLNAYAQRLTKSQQREWEKIAGRFEEIIWHHPLDQVAMLIANALDVNMEAIPADAALEMTTEMQKALQLGWFGYNVNATLLTELAPKLYPLDPIVLPVLVRMFSTFGQNERSLFSFLLGAEDFGLREFVLRTEGRSQYRLHNLYDYARDVFGSKLAALSFHWKAIDEAVTGHLAQDDFLLNILKTIGLINLINSDALIPSKEIVLAATSEDAERVLEELHRHHRIHYRGHAGGYCIWPHSSVNIDDCYQQAVIALSPATTDIKSVLKERLSTRPIVARRHYIETGNLRYFAVHYVECADLKNAMDVDFDADGLIIVPLCETLREVQEALSIIEAPNTVHRANVVIAVPGALQYLAEYLEEVRRWEWIERSVGELRHDKFAREEVSRQLASASLALQHELQKAIGLTTITADSELSWYQNGQRQAAVVNNKAVMGLLADICDATYALSPRIHNELVNRRELSSAAASARLRLCERLFEHSNQPYLGMDREKHPPEMSMYLSVMQAAGFHREIDGAWELGLPDPAIDAASCNVIPAMECIEALLGRKRNERVQVTDLFDELQRAPYGVRTGMVPLLLAVFIVINEQSIALYEDGSFIPRITGTNYLRLIKAPETFDIQFYPIGTLRTSLFSRLAIDLGINHTDPDRVALLDIARPLFVFMSGLPEFVMNSGTLSERTIRIRNLLRTTRDPVNLLFTDLPLACEVEDLNGEYITAEVIGEFSKRLKNAIDELRARYPELLNGLLQSLLREFYLKGSFEENREALAKRASSLTPFVTESARALWDSGKFAEISKDVSAFANANGGVLIYGIAENREERHFPGLIDPIDRKKISKERLEQIINTTVRPRIYGIKIHVVAMPDNEAQVIYILEIPKGDTAHQADDKKYYRRHNFTVEPLYDHEIRDIMNRQKAPVIKLLLMVVRKPNICSPNRNLLRYHKPAFPYALYIYIENVGKVYAKYVNVKLTLPEMCVDDRAADEEERGLSNFTFDNKVRDLIEPPDTTRSTVRLEDHNKPKQYGPARYEPLLPGMHIKLEEINLTQQALDPGNQLSWTIYADNAEPQTGIIEFSAIHQVG